MFTGLTVATVIGVPLGTPIGQHSNWHMSFVFIVVGLIGLIATSILVPKGLPIPGKINLSGLARIFTNKSILMFLYYRFWLVEELSRLILILHQSLKELLDFQQVQ